jgi:ADP-heptose:LPS heptosyltransferase
MPNSKHILVLRFSAMGDVAMTVPVLRAFTEQYPDVKITVVTRAFFKPMFQGLKNTEIYVADLKGKHKGLFGLYTLAKELKQLGFDEVADLHNVLRTKILKYFFLGKKFVQINKGRSEKKNLIGGKQFQQLKTTHQRYADVFAKLGYQINLTEPSFPQNASLSQELKPFIINLSKKTIGIAPFAAHESKMYPLEKMEMIISELAVDYNVILFGGGEKEVIYLTALAEKFEGVESVAGKLSFENELHLISNLDVILSMDSGNAHLAAIFGINVITIWGVTHPYAGFSPFNQPEDYALVADRDQFPLIPTSVYGNKFPEDYLQAAGSISVDVIVNKVKSVVPLKKA